MRRLLPAGLVAALLALAAVPALAAAPTIVLQKGMRGVRLRMTPAQVKAVLGDPLKNTPGGNFNPYYVYPDHFQVGFEHGIVTDIRSESKNDRAAGGIGYGSSRAAVKRRLKHVKGAKCFTNSFDRAYECTVGKPWPNRPETTFLFGKKQHVTAVFIDLWPKTYIPPKS